MEVNGINVYTKTAITAHQIKKVEKSGPSKNQAANSKAANAGTFTIVCKYFLFVFITNLSVLRLIRLYYSTKHKKSHNSYDFF